ncbi:MAG: 7-cyano-7-deazaguanine synthase QueC [Kistimonas sp.]|nr:7-cyano-7-deazaguanine synthase QueC [Kistimonas sp.]
MDNQYSCSSRKAVVVYSGGMDSFTVLHHVRALGYNAAAISFNYGQRHSRELECAAKVSAGLGIEHKIVDLSSIAGIFGDSALTSTGTDVPEGNYGTENMKQTVVPNRNMVMLSLAVSYALSKKADVVFYGAHAGDHVLYPDCRPEFVEAINGVTRLCDWQPVKVEAPWLHASKADILRRGLAMELDYSDTWTCYNGRKHSCGRCSACLERLQAFAANQACDPLIYEDQAPI